MNQADQRMMIGAAAILACIGLGVFVLPAELSTYHTLMLGVRARQTEINELRSRKAALTEAAQKLTTLSAQIEKLKLAVPTDPSFPELVSQLVSLSGKAHVDLISLQPGRVDPNAKEAIVTVSARGTFPDILALLRGTETNLRPVTVKTLNLTKSGDPSRPDQLSATFQLGFSQNREGGNTL